MAHSPEIHSGAFGFMSFLSNAVDPRTGLYTLSIKLPALKANALAGPELPLTLGFSPLNNQDSGYGHGWNLQLSQYDLNTRVVSLHTGESFKVESRDGAYYMPEQKLESFHFEAVSASEFRVVHKSGLVEVLREQVGLYIAVPEEVYSAEGRKLSLHYGRHDQAPMLDHITDDYGTLLSVTREGNKISYLLHPGAGKKNLPSALFSASLDTSKHWVSAITLPDGQAGWQFSYRELNGLIHVTSAQSPLGGLETIAYDDLGHPYPPSADGTQRPNLRRVTKVTQDPGHGMPVTVQGFTYNVVPSHSFLGFGAQGVIWSQDGLDNLYRAKAAYDYGSLETQQDSDGNTLATIERLYNRFHLLKDTITTRDGAYKQRQSTVYQGDDDEIFDKQPPYFQMPLRVETVWSMDGQAGKEYREVEWHEYDLAGNLTLRIDKTSMALEQEWYPAKGEEGLCPEDPEGFCRNLKRKVEWPAGSFDIPSAEAVARQRIRHIATPSQRSAALVKMRSRALQDPQRANILQTTQRYQQLPSFEASAKPWLAVSESDVKDLAYSNEPLISITATDLHLKTDTEADRVEFGRPAKEALTLFTSTDALQPRRSAENTVSKSHRYTSSDGLTLAHTSEMTSDVDTLKYVVHSTLSCLNGKLLVEEDENDNVVHYAYDALGQVLSEKVSPGTPYEAERKYSYTFGGLGGDNVQELEDAVGAVTRSYVDGSSRIIRQTRYDPDHATRGLRATRDADGHGDIYRAAYDNRGQLTEETFCDWLPDRDLALQRTFAYDGWGHQSEVTEADGVTRYNDLDVFARTQTTWATGLGKIVSTLNAFDKVEKVEEFDLEGRSISKRLDEYDGLGRSRVHTDANGLRTQYRYDAHGRMIESELPDATRLYRTYATHSTEAKIADLSAVLEGKTLQLGVQVFDGLGRLSQVRVGPRTTRYEFDSSRAQPDRKFSPAQALTSYRYIPALTGRPTSIESAEINATFEYDLRRQRSPLLQTTKAAARSSTTVPNGCARKPGRMAPRPGRPPRPPVCWGVWCARRISRSWKPTIDTTNRGA